MIFVSRVLGRGVALALFGHGVNQDRALAKFLDVVEDGQQVFQIVPVDRADIVEAQFLEQRAAGEEGAGEFLGAACRLVQEGGEFGDHGLGRLAGAAIDRAGDQTGQVGPQGAGGGSDGHVIVVKNDNEARVHGPCIVHRLIGHAGRHRTVADDGNDIARLFHVLAGLSHAQASRDRCR